MIKRKAMSLFKEMRLDLTASVGRFANTYISDGEIRELAV
jgi:hypothetical protein